MNLENLGVQEMSAQEAKEVDGGLLGVLVVLGIAFGLGYLLGTELKK